MDDEHVCYACATRDMVMRDHEREHEKDKDARGKFSWRDGRLVSVRPAGTKDVHDARAGRKRLATRQ